MRHVFVLSTFVAVAFVVSACQTTGTGPASIAGGECRVFLAPPHAIKGKTRSDQAYVDDVTESGVASCGWKRPAPHPDDKPRVAAKKQRRWMGS